MNGMISAAFRVPERHCCVGHSLWLWIQLLRLDPKGSDAGCDIPVPMFRLAMTVSRLRIPKGVD